MRRLAIVSVVGVAALVLLTGAAPAVGGGFRVGGPGVLPIRDGWTGGTSGYGDWFQRACAGPGPGGAACNAQVVTDAGGVPLVTNSTPPSSAYGPAQIGGAYDLGSLTASPVQTVAIVDAYGDQSIASDLAIFDANFHLPALGGCTPSSTTSDCFEQVNETGGTSLPAGNSGWELEVSLDVETVHSLCQNCNIILVEASSASFGDLGAAEDEAAALGANVITNSWGASDFSGESSLDSDFDHPGVAITAAAGDDGYGVEYPAASPDVTAVGGTTLHVTGSGPYGYGSETVWDGSGSGCSRYESKPAWQDSAVPSAGCAGRAVNDVAADADPNTGLAVYDSVSYEGESGWFQVGGTSLSTQVIGAVYALTGNTSGINGATSGSPAYNDPGALHAGITGSNGSCSPSILCNGQASGWSGPAGLGSPDGLGAFESGTPQPGFTLSVSPSTIDASVGGAAGTTTVTAHDLNGFDSGVTLATGALPNDVNASFSPSPTTATSTLTLTAASGATAGTYTVTVIGTSPGTTTQTTQVTLVVEVPSFTLSASPSSRSVSSSGSATYTITVSDVDGFSGTVGFSASGVPSHTTASFSPASSASSTTLTLTTSGASSGTSKITITGTQTGGAATAKTTVTLTVSGRHGLPFARG